MLILPLGLAVLLVRVHSPLAILSLAPVGIMLQTGGGFESMASDLTKQGMNARAPAAIVGKSGVKHEFAFALVPESGRAKIVLDTELSVKEVDEMKVLKFYVKVFDVGPEKSVLCVSPKLGTRAATLAREYGIVVIENEVPKMLVPMAEKLVRETIGLGFK
jgi:hypothetical protein